MGVWPPPLDAFTTSSDYAWPTPSPTSVMAGLEQTRAAVPAHHEQHVWSENRRNKPVGVKGRGYDARPAAPTGYEAGLQSKAVGRIYSSTIKRHTKSATSGMEDAAGVPSRYLSDKEEWAAARRELAKRHKYRANSQSNYKKGGELAYLMQQDHNGTNSERSSRSSARSATFEGAAGLASQVVSKIVSPYKTLDKATLITRDSNEEPGFEAWQIIQQMSDFKPINLEGRWKPREGVAGVASRYLFDKEVREATKKLAAKKYKYNANKHDYKHGGEAKALMSDLAGNQESQRSSRSTSRSETFAGAAGLNSTQVSKKFSPHALNAANVREIQSREATEEPGFEAFATMYHREQESALAANQATARERADDKAGLTSLELNLGRGLKDIKPPTAEQAAVDRTPPHVLPPKVVEWSSGRKPTSSPLGAREEEVGSGRKPTSPPFDAREFSSPRPRHSSSRPRSEGARSEGGSEGGGRELRSPPMARRREQEAAGTGDLSEARVREAWGESGGAGAERRRAERRAPSGPRAAPRPSSAGASSPRAAPRPNADSGGGRPKSILKGVSFNPTVSSLGEANHVLQSGLTDKFTAQKWKALEAAVERPGVHRLTGKAAVPKLNVALAEKVRADALVAKEKTDAAIKAAKANAAQLGRAAAAAEGHKIGQSSYQGQPGGGTQDGGAQRGGAQRAAAGDATRPSEARMPSAAPAPRSATRAPEAAPLPGSPPFPASRSGHGSLAPSSARSREDSARQAAPSKSSCGVLTLDSLRSLNCSLDDLAAGGR